MGRRRSNDKIDGLVGVDVNWGLRWRMRRLFFGSEGGSFSNGCEGDRYCVYWNWWD